MPWKLSCDSDLGRRGGACEGAGGAGCFCGFVLTVCPTGSTAGAGAGASSSLEPLSATDT